MTKEQLLLSGACFVFAHATEDLMKRTLSIDKTPLKHEAKMMWNGMTKSVKQAFFYYDQFCEIVGNAIFETSGNDGARRFDEMRREANEAIRMWLHIENAVQNGCSVADIEKTLSDLSHEDGKHLTISDETINRFRLIE